MADEPLLATITGEHFQPVRLHYRVFESSGLLRVFKKLRCVDHDPTRERWVWLYDHEARGLPFKQAYAQLAKHLRPIVIGSFFLRGEDELLLDLRSCERAVLALPFFDKHLPRRVAKVTEAEVVNRLFSAAASATVTPDSLFDHQVSTLRDPDAEIQRVIALTAQVEDPQEKFKIVMEDMETRAKRPLPEIERLPIHYYEDGLQGFATSLQLRQIVALQHWLGKSAYTLFDAIQSIQPVL